MDEIIESNTFWGENLNKKNLSYQGQHFTAWLHRLSRIYKHRYMYENTGSSEDMFCYAEEMVMKYGKFAIYDHPEMGIIGLQMVEAGAERNLYGKPIKYYLRNFMGDLMLWVNVADPRMFIVADDRIYTPAWIQILYFARRLSEVDGTIDSNIEKLRLPYIITCPKEAKKDMEAILQNYKGRRYIVLDPNLDIKNTIQVLPTEIKYVIDKLEDEKNVIKNEFLRYIGFYTPSVDKQERVNNIEARSGFDELISNDIYSYQNRKNLIEWCRERSPKLKELLLLKSNDYIYNLEWQYDNDPDLADPNTPNVTPQKGAVTKEAI